MKRLLLTVLLSVVFISPGWADGWRYSGYGHHHGGHYYQGHHYGRYYGGDMALAFLTGMVFVGIVSDFFEYSERSYPASRTTVYVDSDDRIITPRRWLRPQWQQRRQRMIRPEFNDCLMTREYTTTVNVDGKKRQAYGTRCMRADKSWVLGPTKLVPKFR